MSDKIDRIPLFIMWMTALAQAAVVLYLPAFPVIAHDLGVTPIAAKMTMTVFFIGYGSSQLIYGTLSDHYGRKPVLLIGLLVFCLGCFVNIFSHSLETFLVARLLQGLGAGSAITIGRSILRDCYSGTKLASVASYTSMGFAIGLGASPIIGAYLQEYLGWQVDFVFLLTMGVVFFFIILKFLPETLFVNSIKMNSSHIFVSTLVSYREIITNIEFLRCLLGGMFAYCVIISYSIVTPFLVQTTLGYSPIVYGWLTLVIAFAYYLGAFLNRIIVLKWGSYFVIAVGTGLIMFSGISMLILAMNSPVTLITIMLPTFVAVFGQAFVFPNAIAGALQNFPTLAGKASAMLSSLQMLLISIFSAGIALFPEDNYFYFAILLSGLGGLSALMLLTYRKKYLTENVS